LRRVRTPFEQLRSPIFHPAGGRLLVVGMSKGTNDLYEVSPRGKLLRRLTDSADDENDPAYTPDGRTVVFSREVRRGADVQRDLFALDVSSSSVRPLTDMAGDEGAPAVSPDGKMIVFTGGGEEGIRNLYRLDLADGKITLLTRVVGGVSSPCFAGDGQRIVYAAFRHGSRAIFTAGPELWTSTGTVVRSSWGVAPSTQARGPWDAVVDRKDFVSDPYRFHASTDLFFPLMYYSSQDGFYIASLWQASDVTGNHELQSSLQYGSGEDFLDYGVRYAYKRFRPQWVVSAGGETYYTDLERTEQRREWSRSIGVVYPLDRFRRLELVASGLHREERFLEEDDRRSTERENVLSGSWVRDTSLGRWLVVTDGSRVRLTQAAARTVFGGTRDYDATEAEVHRFFPTGGESALAFRAVSGTSAGPSPRFFRIAGGDRIRGYPRNDDDSRSSRYVIGTVEWRAPLAYLDGGVVPLFPEIACKALFGVLFVDGGYDGTPEDRQNSPLRRSRGSVGAGLRIPSFIFQTYALTLSVDVAKRLDSGAWAWYFYIGPRF
jgi:hypothetical protein